MPWQIFTRGPLFEAVQALRLFPDSKKFPDMIPRRFNINSEHELQEKLKTFRRIWRDAFSSVDNFNNNLQALGDSFSYEEFKGVAGLGKGIIAFRSHLYDFIDKYFQDRPEPAILNKSVPRTTSSMEAYIDSAWYVLRRDSSNLPKDMFEGTTLIQLEYPYVVAGGRFDEVYYWDAYFTGEGLVLSGYLDLFDCMVKNYAMQISEYGYVPNGNRRYYESRSQAPFYCSMIDLLARMKGIKFLKEYRIENSKEKSIGYIEMVEKEYQFWTRGNRVVNVGEDTLSRYWDDFYDKDLIPPVQPRPEAYDEDTSAFARTQYKPEEAEIFFRHIRAAAESGWDFSSRWFQLTPDREGGIKRERTTIRTTEILPVDLNALLFGMEKKLSEWSGNNNNKYKGASELRKKAILKYFWNDELGWFFDYWLGDNKSGKAGRTDVWSLAGAYPLFTKLFDRTEGEDKAKVDKMAKVIRERFLRAGGVVTTLHDTGEQWDYPNGWAPLQWIVVRGLLNYDHHDLALEIAKRFVACVGRTYKREGRIMEKYNVCEPEAIAGGGEYIVQHGFGWTNGVVKAFINKFRSEMEKDLTLKEYLE